MTIHELRQNNCKVRVLHWRYLNKDGFVLTRNRPELLIPNKTVKLRKREVFPRGGKTQIEILFPNNVHASKSTVCSVSDGFCKKKGVAICLNRLREEISRNLKIAKITENETNKPKNIINKIKKTKENELKHALIELVNECRRVITNKSLFDENSISFRKAIDLLYREE